MTTIDTVTGHLLASLESGIPSLTQASMLGRPDAKNAIGGGIGGGIRVGIRVGIRGGMSDEMSGDREGGGDGDMNLEI